MVTDLDLQCPNGNLPLYLAIIGDNFLIVEALADAGANVDARHSDGNPILYHAIVLHRGLNEVEALIRAGVDTNAIGIDGNPLLYHAIVQPRGLNVVESLLEAGADVNATDAEGNTLLGIAVEKGDINVIDALIDAGAGQAPICNALALGDLHAVQQFIGNNPDINASDCGGDPLLSTAIKNREPEIVRILVDAGADVNARDKNENPLLYTAVYWGEPEIVRILVDAGSDVNARNSRGEPVLYTAVDEGGSDIVLILLDADADVNAKDWSGTSPVKRAFEEEKHELFRTLVDAGAEIDFPPPIPIRVQVVDRTHSSLTVDLTVQGGIETHYAVRRRNAAESGEWVDLEVRDTDGRFEDRGLNADSTYYYAIRACNAVGCSELSLEAGGVTESSGQVDAPAAPLLSAETRRVSFLFAWNTYIDLTWDAVDGATYYEVYRENSLASPLSAPRTAWSSSDHLASYQVKACNKAGCSPFSNTK